MNDFRLVEQVGKTEVEATVKRWRAADSDVRILKVQRDAAGNRNRPLALYTQEEMKDWPHVGAGDF